MTTVDIITRTKDREIFLPRCIETVLSQSYTDWTHIIVNDGGQTDKLQELLLKYHTAYNNRLKIINNVTSLGMEAASNIGIKAGTSRYIVILDDDDSWDKDFLQKMINQLQKKTWIDVKGVICHTDIVYEELKDSKIVQKKRVAFNHWMRTVDLLSVFFKNKFTPVSFMFERSALETIGFFDENLPVCGDWDFNIRFLMEYEIIVLPEVLAFWHQRPTGRGANGNSLNSGDLHTFYRSRIINRWLRESAKSGKIGYGELFSMSILYEFTRKLHLIKTRAVDILTFGRSKHR